MTIPTRTCRTCGLAKTDKEFPHVQGGGEKRLSTECLACLNAKDAVGRPTAIPACPVCKRPDTAPHDTWCQHWVGEVYTIPPLDLAGMAITRKLAEAKAETRRIVRAMRSQSTDLKPLSTEPTHRAEEPDMTHMEARDNIPDPEAELRIALKAPAAETAVKQCKCGRGPMEQRKGRAGGLTTTGKCVTCRREYHAARRQAMQEAAEQAKAAKLAQAIESLGDPEPDLAVINEPGPVVRKLETTAASCPQTVDSSDLANLRAERVRCAAYLQDLDRRIEEAEALELMGQRSPDELRALIAEAKRMAQLANIALRVRGVA